MSAEKGYHYIDGGWVGEAPNGFADSLNPSDGSVIGNAPLGSAALAEQAVMASRGAFETSHWAEDPRARAQVLLDFADVLESRKDEIAALMARENGKVLGQAAHEVAVGFGEARYYAGVARNVFG